MDLLLVLVVLFVLAAVFGGVFASPLLWLLLFVALILGAFSYRGHHHHV